MTYRSVGRLFSITGVLLVLTACGVNDIPTYDEQVKAAWAQVENQYRRRADLVPNLVEIVKGFAAQERETLTAVVEARSRVAQMTLPSDIVDNPEALQRFQDNQGALSGALSRLLVVVERYPELKSNQNFLALQSQIEGTENRIAVARRDFILAVQTYNTELRTFPGRWWASFLYSDMEPRETFSDSEAIAEAPQIRFSD